MRGGCLKTRLALLDPLPPDIFVCLHCCIPLLPAVGPGVYHPAGCRALEPGGLDYDSLVALTPFHCPSAESRGYSIVIFRTPAAQSLHLHQSKFVGFPYSIVDESCDPVAKMMFFISIPLWIKVDFPYSIVKELGPVGGNLNFRWEK